MTNLADFIERFIQQKLSEGAVGHVLVRRNELADELSCAPSQISYVLSTRFTLDRGYLVESRRGSGGFVRIARLEPSQVVFAAQTRQEQDDEDFEARHAAAGSNDAQKERRDERRGSSNAPDVSELIDRLAAARMLTGREEAMLRHLFSVLDHFLDDDAQRAVFRQTVHELLTHS